MNWRRRATKFENLLLELMRFLFTRLVSRHSPEELCTGEALKPQARNGSRTIIACNPAAQNSGFCSFTLYQRAGTTVATTLCETLIAP